MATMLRELFHVPELDDFPGRFAERAAHIVAELQRLWKRTCIDAAEQRTIPALHATRDRYRALLNGHLGLLEK